jgi:F0F1-type ATP synthase delta subunit
MTKKQIKKIAMASYTTNELDIKKVKRISKFLTRNSLKQYIKELKLLENQKTITVLTPSLNKNSQNELRKQFAKIFTEKKIIIENDSSLLLGVKVVDNDLIYDLSLKNTLNNLNKHINEQYD